MTPPWVITAATNTWTAIQTVNSPTIQGTVGAGTGLTLPAFTAGGDITGGSGFSILTSAGDLVLNPAGDISVAKSLDFTTSTPMKVSGTTARPWISELVGVKGNVADNTATGFITVTVVNSDFYGQIQVDYIVVSENFDRLNSGRIRIAIARFAGATVIISAVSEIDAQQTANSRGAETITLSFAISAVTGAAGATQTFTINFTADSSANVESEILYRAKLLSGRYNQADAGGTEDITMAAA